MGAKKLVIVESPTKAKTIGGYLGDDYEVIASVGHIRDLAEPSELPTELKKGPFGKFAVDVDQDFAPYYVVNANKKKTVTELKRALKDADELWLATDEDREGEAIAWHLLEVLKPKVPVRRMVFHEITKDAIEQAKANTRDIDFALVDAQETRRILDRLYGYDISPVLWRKVAPKLSAGRVQSAATRIVVDRERERMAFVAAEYWDLTARFKPGADAVDAAQFEARLVRLDGVGLIPARNAVLSVMPVDDFVEEAIFRSTFRQERDTLEPVHREIIDCCTAHEPNRAVVPLVGTDFYNRVRAAHTLVQTSEPRLYANVILRKGVIDP